jgi:hypothetical protein
LPARRRSLQSPLSFSPKERFMSKKRFSLAAVKKLAADLAASDASAKRPAAEDDPPWLSHVAMLTGVLAALAGVLTVRATNLTNDAIYQSNQAILAQTQASDAWSEYQADSIKARIVDTQLMASGSIGEGDRASLEESSRDLRGRQPKLKQAATDKEAERNNYLKHGLDLLGEKDLMNYASLAAQIGIALASVAALVKKRPVFHVAVTIGVIGVAIAAYAVLGPMLMP